MTGLVGPRGLSILILVDTKRDAVFLKGLMETGEYRAVIDRRYRPQDVVEACRYVGTGQKTGTWS